MNIHSDAVFNTDLYNNREATPFILSSASLYPEAVHLRMEDIKQNIQDATSDYIISIPISEKISLILLMTQSSTSRHFYSLTIPVINLRLPRIISPLILELKCALQPLSLPLHTLPMWASLKTPCQISPKNHPLLSPHIHLTIQGKGIPPLQIIHQVTIPEFNPHNFQNILHRNHLQNKLRQLLLPPQKYALPVEIL